MTELEYIRANAEMIVRELGPLGNLGVGFGFNRVSVEYVEGYIERLRCQPLSPPTTLSSQQSAATRDPQLSFHSPG